MINVYRYKDPSCRKKDRYKIGEVKTKSHVMVFQDAYVKGIFDGIVSTWKLNKKNTK